MSRVLLAVLFGLAVAFTPTPARADEAPPPVEAYLIDGALEKGEEVLRERLRAAPGDDEARFSLGVLQFLRAVERRMQAFYRHGLRRDAGFGLLPLTNLPVPANPEPQPLTYEEFRRLLQGWIDDLSAVEATLEPIRDPDVRLPLRVGLVRLDFDGDGRFAPEETLWSVYARYNTRARGVDAEAAQAFVIAFDRGDVDWLRGYCHLLRAVAEVPLAHDFRAFFDHAGHVLFAGAVVPYPFLRGDRCGFAEIADLIAAIHLVRLPVAEPERLRRALGHLERMIALSRSSWASILAESDDDHEWIPNPRQDTVVPRGRVTQEMVDGWFAALDQFEAVLAGRKLIPFWRVDPDRRGINLRRVLTEPREFDLVLWVQGTAAAPYLEAGELTDPASWQRLDRLFRGEFLGFAIWFN